MPAINVEIVASERRELSYYDIQVVIEYVEQMLIFSGRLTLGCENQCLSSSSQRKA